MDLERQLHVLWSTSPVTASTPTGDTRATLCRGSPAPGWDKRFAGINPCRSRTAPPWKLVSKGLTLALGISGAAKAGADHVQGIAMGDKHPNAPAAAGHQQSRPAHRYSEARAGLGLHQEEFGSGAKLCLLHPGAWEQACTVPRSPHGQPAPAKVHERVPDHPLPAAHPQEKELGGLRVPARDAHHPLPHVFKCLATK